MVQRKERTFFFGQVCRMIHKGKDFRKPVAFDDPRAKDIRVSLNRYKQVGDMSFTKDTEACNVSFSDIMCAVNLSVNVSNGNYKIDEKTLTELKEIVSRICPTTTVTRRPIEHGHHRNQDEDDDGRRRSVVEPSTSADGQRRSQRTRVQIQYTFQ